MKNPNKRRIYHNITLKVIHVYSVCNSLTEQQPCYHTKQQISGGVTTMRRGQQKPAHEKHVLHPLIVKPDLSRTYGRQQPRRSIAAAS